MNQPNILILHCDQLRQDCLGFNGNADVRTPNLDRLAADSVNYENHYTVYPICTPSRYSFWSSMCTSTARGTIRRRCLPDIQHFRGFCGSRATIRRQSGKCT